MSYKFKKNHSQRFILLLFLFVCSLACDKSIDYHIEPPQGFAPRNYEPAWSPDGRTIAFVISNFTEGIGIFLVDTNGTNKRQIFKGLAGNPSWSPDGKWIVFDMGGEIYKIKLTGDSLTQLTFTSSNYFPSWSPDGEWILYSNGYCGNAYDTILPPHSCGTILMRKDGSEKRLLSLRCYFPDWYSFSSKIIFFSGAVTPAGHVFGDSLWSYDIPSQLKTPIALLQEPDNLINQFLRMSPDNTKIMFTSQKIGSVSPQIWIIDASGSNMQKLTQACGYSSDWSPDGEKIVYCNCEENNGYLWIMDKDGTNKKQLTFRN